MQQIKKRSISDILKEKNITKLAYGHHANDAAETLFMNIFNNKKLGSFSPRVAYDNHNIEIIRPLIYTEEETIRKIKEKENLPLLDIKCEYGKCNIRTKYKELLNTLENHFNIKCPSKYVVGALENIDKINIWENIQSKK